MKRLLLLIICAACALPVWAEDAMLSFYQRQAVAQGRSPRQDRAFAAALARDVAQWVRSHEGAADMKKALLMQADYHLRAKEEAQALVALYQVRFYFPSAQDVALLSAQIETAMEGLNRTQKAQALKLLAVDTADLEGLQARKAALLTHLVQGNLEEIYKPVCALFEDFFTQYPKDAQTDKLILQYGDWHRQNGNYLAAILEYKKVYDLFPSTIYKAASLRLTADVYANDLKEYDMATALYEQVLKQYPTSSEIGIVYKHMAMMQENRKLYESALDYYDKAIEQLGTEASAYEAWQGKADVLIKTKEYGAAYDTLVKGAEVFAADENKYVDMLTQAAQVGAKRLKNPGLQTAALEKILSAYPQTRSAPELMYEAAGSYEKQEKTPRAIALYKQLVITYPTDKYATRAQKRLNKLEK